LLYRPETPLECSATCNTIGPHRPNVIYVDEYRHFQQSKNNRIKKIIYNFKKNILSLFACSTLHTSVNEDSINLYMDDVRRYLDDMTKISEIFSGKTFVIHMTNAKNAIYITGDSIYIEKDVLNILTCKHVKDDINFMTALMDIELILEFFSVSIDYYRDIIINGCMISINDLANMHNDALTILNLKE